MGGDKDHEDESNKYLKLLEADDEKQKGFIESVLYLLRSYKFDGLDLAYQFPRIDYNAKEESWKSLKKSKSFGNISEANKTVQNHKEQFVELIQNLRKALLRHELLLGLTVLPNVNASQFFNVSSLINNLDFVNLQTFDSPRPELESLKQGPSYHSTSLYSL
ncbi:hypothetical protein DOY81_011739 [Sarcophaga bullata]|nr:hypothetical protein DOY81_011739 [Sarcophaga bullata]